MPGGHIGSHGLERDIIYADGTGEGVGYFTFIEGIPGPFFAGFNGGEGPWISFGTGGASMTMFSGKPN